MCWRPRAAHCRTRSSGPQACRRPPVALVCSTSACELTSYSSTPSRYHRRYCTRGLAWQGGTAQACGSALRYQPPPTPGTPPAAPLPHPGRSPQPAHAGRQPAHLPRPPVHAVRVVPCVVAGPQVAQRAHAVLVLVAGPLQRARPGVAPRGVRRPRACSQGARRRPGQRRPASWPSGGGAEARRAGREAPSDSLTGVQDLAQGDAVRTGVLHAARGGTAPPVGPLWHERRHLQRLAGVRRLHAAGRVAAAAGGAAARGKSGRRAGRAARDAAACDALPAAAWEGCARPAPTLLAGALPGALPWLAWSQTRQTPGRRAPAAGAGPMPRG